MFGFVTPPPLFYVALAPLLAAYLLVAELVKGWFYKRQAYRLEQVLVPRRAFYMTKSAKLLQAVIAAISLRAEDEFTIESLIDDLNHALTYPVNANQAMKTLQNLRRSSLISVDRKEGTIKREASLSEYVQKSIIDGPTWGNVSEKWRKIHNVLLNRYGMVNAEYEELIPKQ